ncbi:SpoIIE family protein phosphatase [Microbacterium sp. Gd 4-13]|uniref:PP2C family protein-serine/threonine phosphatase n=1 Tax=Microbacterium sp. Gd 4-13 TaxID=2173179 RepID=UPI001403CC6E|nr:SpoIIE family protein phosphatase [Microbacterium sp. Gd 4-13]
MNTPRQMIAWPVSTASGSILGARSVNHDRVLATPDALIVVDGAGESREAAGTATAGLGGALLGLTKATQSQQPSALAIVQEAASAVATFGPSGASATITALQLVATDLPTAQVAWLGDSPAFLLRDGVLQQLTRPHNRAQEMAERHLLTFDEAKVSPMSTVLTRGIGALDGAPESISVALAEGDRLLVASDGVLAIPDARLAWALSQGDDARAAVDAVLEAAVDHRASDNVAVAVLVVDVAPWSASGVFVASDPRERAATYDTDELFLDAPLSPPAEASGLRSTRESKASLPDGHPGRRPRREIFGRGSRRSGNNRATGPLPD